ncbi:MAG: molecular chaperone TorD family protein [Gammaproteobacteria bacterium]
MTNSMSDDTCRAGQLAMARSGVYGFLAGIYRDPPTESFLQQVADPSFISALSDLGINLSPDSIGLSNEHTVRDLAVEYTGLFIGPGKHISPHESVHRKNEGGGLWGKSTADVKYFIQSSGYKYRQEFNGLPDHISVELEFMGGISGQEAGGWRQQDVRLIRNTRQVQQEFLTEHLVNWLPQFCSEVIEAAELAYYREMAMLTNRFMEFEVEELSQWPELSDDIVMQFGISRADSINVQVSG